MEEQKEGGCVCREVILAVRVNKGSANRLLGYVRRSRTREDVCVGSWLMPCVLIKVALGACVDVCEGARGRRMCV